MYCLLYTGVGQRWRVGALRVMRLTTNPSRRTSRVSQFVVALVIRAGWSVGRRVAGWKGP